MATTEYADKMSVAAKFYNSQIKLLNRMSEVDRKATVTAILANCELDPDLDELDIKGFMAQKKALINLDD